MNHFSEREFYLAEFRGRSIGIVWPDSEPPNPEPLASVISELVANGSRVVLMSPHEEVLVTHPVAMPVESAEPHAGPKLWRQLRKYGSAGLRITASAFEVECQWAVQTLRLSKVVRILSAPPVERVEGVGRISVVDLAHLDRLLGEVGGGAETERVTDQAGAVLRVREGQHALLESIRTMIRGGVPAVNVCASKDLVQELFTYAGAGMFFTRDRYAEVRPLALDDYDPASDLIDRGEADGFLVPRTGWMRDEVLTHGVGVFIEGRYLAGIGALLPHAEENAIEVASLFALTRYAGEGVGGQIVRYAIERAQRDATAYLFSCTTSERVVAFFERHGFVCVTQDDVPKAKWQDYDPQRRARVRCLRFDP